MSSAIMSAAETFIFKNARLLERLRFAYLFRGESSEPVLRALAAYQNADGGFGNALEPDLRGPASQPIPVWTALGIMDEAGELPVSLTGPALDFLGTITTNAGGVPFVLPSAKQWPHAPWWESDDDLPAALNPTAGIAAFLLKHHVEHPWLAKAQAFCWQEIEDLRETSPYELKVILAFLENAPERTRAEQAFSHVHALVERQGFIEADPDAPGEVHFPLEFAPTPDSLGRKMFSDELIERHLDALVRQQAPDGGWTVNWPIWTPVTEFEWHGVATVETLKTLKAYGRWRPQ